MIRSRLVATVACMLALSGCTSEKNSLFGRLTPIVKERIFGEKVPAGPAREFTRAELNKIPYATISIARAGQPPGYVVAVADNGGYVVYEDPARRSVTMHGGLVTGTGGFQYDLKAVASQLDDPVVVPTPVPAWPGSIERSYRFALRGRDDYQVAVGCAYERGPREFIEVLELRFEVIRVVETCSNARRTFVNTYWADADNGFIWKSEQWIGPRVEPVTIEIIRPFGSG